MRIRDYWRVARMAWGDAAAYFWLAENGLPFSMGIRVKRRGWRAFMPLLRQYRTCLRMMRRDVVVR